MLTRLVLKNFQVHHKFVVDLDERVTCLVGRSDSGKSSVLRALRWVCLNRPQGDDFIGDFGEAPYASVRLEVDGHTVGRKRTANGNNTYRLDGRVLRSFGAGVPDPVAGVLNVGAANWQQQIDPPLWFTQPPGEVARELNQIVNLIAIDRAMEHAGSVVRKTKAEVGVSEQRLKDAEAKALSLAWVERMDIKLVKIERLSSKVDRLGQGRLELHRTLSECLGGQLAVRRGDRRLALAKTVSDRLLRVKELSERREELVRLLELVEKNRQAAARPIPKTEKLQAMHEKCESLRESKRALEAILTGLRQLRYARQTAELELESAQGQLKTITRGRCPICGSKMEGKSRG